MAVAVQMLNHRHARLGQQARNQALAAARHDHIDVFTHGNKLADRRAIGRINHLHRIGRQAGGGQALMHQGSNGTIAANRLGAAAQDGCIARFDAKSGRISGHIRAGLVNNPNNTQWDAHLANLNTTRAKFQIADLANRIGQGSNLLHAVRHGRDVFF